MDALLKKVQNIAAGVTDDTPPASESASAQAPQTPPPRRAPLEDVTFAL